MEENTVDKFLRYLDLWIDSSYSNEKKIEFQKLHESFTVSELMEVEQAVKTALDVFSVATQVVQFARKVW